MKVRLAKQMSSLVLRGRSKTSASFGESFIRTADYADDTDRIGDCIFLLRIIEALHVSV